MANDYGIIQLPAAPNTWTNQIYTIYPPNPNAYKYTVSGGTVSNYSFGFTGFSPVPATEPPDPFDTYAAEIRRIAELEESLQGS